MKKIDNIITKLLESKKYMEYFDVCDTDVINTFHKILIKNIDKIDTFISILIDYLIVAEYIDIVDGSIIIDSTVKFLNSIEINGDDNSKVKNFHLLVNHYCFICLNSKIFKIEKVFLDKSISRKVKIKKNIYYNEYKS